MGRPELNMTLDLSDASNKRRVLTTVGAMTGLYRVSIEPTRETRTTRANRYYWGCICTPFAQFLSSQDYQKTSPEEAHRLLKQKLLPKRTVVDPITGAVLGYLLTDTHTMSVEDFADYIERARAYLLDMFGIQTPEAGEALPEPAEARA